MITVACVWVQANVHYDLAYVVRLHRMVKRHLARNFRFVVFTDRPKDVLGFETVTIPRPSVGIPGWWSKIELFNPVHGLTGRVLYLDLDVLVVGDLDEVVDYSVPFALVPDGGTFKGKGHLRVVKKYNSSVMVWDDRVRPKLERIYPLFTPDVPRRLWGDQDFIGEMLPYEETFPGEWFPRLSEIRAQFWQTAKQATAQLLEQNAKVVLSKKPKNAEAANQWPWFKEMWG